jgi:hypothetical protein
VRHDLEERLREVADALFQQAIAAMRRTRRAWTSQRIGYDEMWSLVLNVGCRTRVSSDAAATSH